MPTSKPLRNWLAASRRRPDRRRPARRLERADRWGGGGAAGRPDRAGRRAGRRVSATTSARASALARRRDGRARSAVESSSAERDELTEPGLHRALGGCPRATATSSTPPPACRSATSRRSCLQATTDALFLCNRGANGIDGLDLLRYRRRPRQRAADHDRHRRPRPAPRHWRPRGAARRFDAGAHRRHRQRRRRHLRLPAPGEALDRGVRGPARHAAGVDAASRRTSSTCRIAASRPRRPHRRRPAGGTGLIEVGIQPRRKRRASPATGNAAVAKATRQVNGQRRPHHSRCAAGTDDGADRARLHARGPDRPERLDDLESASSGRSTSFACRCSSSSLGFSRRC